MISAQSATIFARAKLNTAYAKMSAAWAKLFQHMQE
jgi:hypothetical protein